MGDNKLQAILQEHERQIQALQTKIAEIEALALEMATVMAANKVQEKEKRPYTKSKKNSTDE